MKNNIKMSEDRKKAMISAIQKYFMDERDEKIGDLAAMMILDFFIEELAVEFYNQGIYDSYKYMSDRVEDILGLQQY